MGVDIAEAGAQALGDELMVGEGIRAAEGHVGVEAGDQHDAGVADDLLGPQGAQQLGGLGPAEGRVEFLGGILRLDRGAVGDGRERALAVHDHGGIEAHGEVHHDVVQADVGEEEGYVRVHHTQAHAFPHLQGVLPVVGPAHADGLQHVHALRLPLVQLVQEHGVEVLVGELVKAGLQGLALAETAGALVEILVLQPQKHGPDLQPDILCFDDAHDVPS